MGIFRSKDVQMKMSVSVDTLGPHAGQLVQQIWSLLITIEMSDVKTSFLDKKIITLLLRVLKREDDLENIEQVIILIVYTISVGD